MMEARPIIAKGDGWSITVDLNNLCLDLSVSAFDDNGKLRRRAFTASPHRVTVQLGPDFVHEISKHKKALRRAAEDLAELLGRRDEYPKGTRICITQGEHKGKEGEILSLTFENGWFIRLDGGLKIYAQRHELEKVISLTEAQALADRKLGEAIADTYRQARKERAPDEVVTVEDALAAVPTYEGPTIPVEEMSPSYEQCGAVCPDKARFGDVTFHPTCTNHAETCDGVNHTHRIGTGQHQVLLTWVEPHDPKRGT